MYRRSDYDVTIKIAIYWFTLKNRNNRKDRKNRKNRNLCCPSNYWTISDFHYICKIVNSMKEEGTYLAHQMLMLLSVD